MEWIAARRDWIGSKKLDWIFGFYQPMALGRPAVIMKTLDNLKSNECNYFEETTRAKRLAGAPLDLEVLGAVGVSNHSCS